MKIKLTQPLSAYEIQEITDARLHINGHKKIEYIATHSGEVTEGTLFLAMQGTKTHGECFRGEVLSRGGIILTDKAAPGSITVPSVSKALFLIAKSYLSSLDSLRYTVAITGSVGKTTTKEILAFLLKKHLIAYATSQNQNSEIGLPLTVLAAPKDTECLILEMGMNHKGEIAKCSYLCEPTHAIITNIGHAHIGNLSISFL